MVLDPTISYGTLLQLITMIFGGFVVVVQMRAALNYQSERLNAVEAEVHELGQVVISAARMEERIISIRTDLTALSVRVTAAEVAVRLPHLPIIHGG